MMKPIKYTVDETYGLVYVKYTNNHVSKTHEYDDMTNIDVDSENNIIGIEFIAEMSEQDIFDKVRKILEEYKQEKLVANIDKKDFIKLSSRQ